MKTNLGCFRSPLAVLAGILVTTALAFAGELTLNRGGALTPEVMRSILVLDMLAAITGGYVTARVAGRSPLKHAFVTAALFTALTSALDYASKTPMFSIVTTSLGIIVAICLGAILWDWHRSIQHGFVAHLV